MKREACSPNESGQAVQLYSKSVLMKRRKFIASLWLAYRRMGIVAAWYHQAKAFVPAEKKVKGAVLANGKGIKWSSGKRWVFRNSYR